MEKILFFILVILKINNCELFDNNWLNKYGDMVFKERKIDGKLFIVKSEKIII